MTKYEAFSFGGFAKRVFFVSCLPRRKLKRGQETSWLKHAAALFCLFCVDKEDRENDRQRYSTHAFRNILVEET